MLVQFQRQNVDLRPVHPGLGSTEKGKLYISVRPLGLGSPRMYLQKAGFCTSHSWAPGLRVFSSAWLAVQVDCDRASSRRCPPVTPKAELPRRLASEVPAGACIGYVALGGPLFEADLRFQTAGSVTLLLASGPILRDLALESAIFGFSRAWRFDWWHPVPKRSLFVRFHFC